CPSWGDPGIESPVRTGTNYGCAVNTNLSAMIANPEDLIPGREPSGNGAAQTAGRAARSYGESTPTGRQGLPAAQTTPQAGRYYHDRARSRLARGLAPRPVQRLPHPQGNRPAA